MTMTMNTGDEAGVWKEDQREGTFKKTKHEVLTCHWLLQRLFLRLHHHHHFLCIQSRTEGAHHQEEDQTRDSTLVSGGGRQGLCIFKVFSNTGKPHCPAPRSAQISVSLSVVAPLTLPPCPLQSLTEGCVRPCVFPCVCVSLIRRLIA